MNGIEILYETSSKTQENVGFRKYTFCSKGDLGFYKWLFIFSTPIKALISWFPPSSL
jgi:hypothetical protein